MQITIKELKMTIGKLNKCITYNTDKLNPIFEVINRVNNAWSGSLWGYQSNVYYKDFQIPPKGAYFSKEWGINNSIIEFDEFNMIGGSIGEWKEYRNEEVTNFINEQISDIKLSQIFQDSDKCKKIFEDCKDDIILIINSMGLLENDDFLQKLIKELEEIIIPSQEDFLKSKFPKKMTFSTRDRRVDGKIYYPPHLILESFFHEKIAIFTLSNLLYKHTNKIIKYLSKKIKRKIHMDRKQTELTNKIFIVHGHDEALKNEVARYIEKLGLEAIILDEQASKGRTIIEQIEQHCSDVSFGIVLYTSCDIGGKTEEDLQPRARQNVVFEHGYLMGKIGRKNIVALVKDKVEKPSDISGVIYIEISGNWKQDLAKEMKEVGYEINLNKTI
jgi:predicted nucleotide-binding protein